MPSPLDYSAIQDALVTALKADALLLNVVDIHSEEDFSYQQGDRPQVFVYFDRYDAPDRLQGLSAGQRTRMHLRYSLWCKAFGIESFKATSDLRNTLLGNLQVALMRNRTWHASIASSWQEGGEVISARSKSVAGSFLAAAEVRLTAECIASTA